jgi:hypothetical protein
VQAVDLKKEETQALDTRKDPAAFRLLAVAGDVEKLCQALLAVHDALPETAEERSLEDLGATLPRATVMRAAIQHLVACFRSHVAELHTVSAYRQRLSLTRDGSPDLSAESEETRRRLYDLIVEQEFTAKPGTDPDDTWVPPYTAEEAGLEVTFRHGRWLAEWRRLEVPDTSPEEEQWELLCVQESEDEPGAVYFHEF